MNPWDLSASNILVWGIVLHLIADWPLQNDWMANNKMKRRARHNKISLAEYYDRKTETVQGPWWDRHSAAYVHAGIHGLLLSIIFGWVAIPLAVVHLLIDTRVPLVWWGTKVVKQTQPQGHEVETTTPDGFHYKFMLLYDLGLEVRIWTDQVFHITCIAIAALLVTM